MGSFSGFLGDAASGFAQAAREDKQRQFEMEHDRRDQLTNLLGKLAGDPTAHPETQQAALQGIAAIHSAPWNKPIKAEPIINSLITRGPQQPTQTATTAGPTTGAPHDLTNLIPPGQPMPTPPTSAGAPMPQVSQQAQFTPPPNMGMRYTPTELAGIEGQQAGAVAGGQLKGQIGARQEALAGMPLPPQEKAMMTLGMPMGALLHNMGSGSGFAGELRKQGYDVPDNIKDDSYVAIKETPIGTTFVPAPVPSSYTVNTEGKAIPKQTAEIQKEERQLTQWKQKNRTRFGQQLALQQNGLQNALAKQDYGTATKTLATSNNDLQAALDRMQTMDMNMEAAKKGDQQAMLSLVANHIGMTLGAQKGARITRAVWDEAMQSAPWMQRVGARFDDRGLLMGVTLSPQQMDQMVRLGHEKVDVLKNHVQSMQNLYDGDLAARKGRPPQPPLTAMPTPPAGSATGGKKQAYRVGNKWYDASTHQEIK